MVPVACLVINACTMSISILSQIHLTLVHVIDITQVANLTFSLLTNVPATSDIAVKTWYSAFCGKTRSLMTRAMRARC